MAVHRAPAWHSVNAKVSLRGAWRRFGPGVALLSTSRAAAAPAPSAGAAAREGDVTGVTDGGADAADVAAAAAEAGGGEDGEAEALKLETYLRTYVSQYHTAYALRLYAEMEDKGLFPTVPVWTELINLAADTRGMMSTALTLYVRLMEHLGDDVSKLLHVPGLEVGDSTNDDARLPAFYPTQRTQDTLRREGVDNTDALVSAYTFQRLIWAAVKDGQLTRAFQLFEDMVDVGHEPSAEVYGTLMDECAKRRLLDRAYDLLSRLISSGVAPVVDTFVPLIDGHLSMGDLEAANRVWQEMESIGVSIDDVRTFNRLIRTCMANGYPDHAQLILARMAKAGVVPDSFTYTVLLKSCQTDGDVDSAFRLLEEMLDNGVTPGPQHHNIALQTCVVGGRLDLAFRHFVAVTARGKPGVTYDGNTYSIVARGCVSLNWLEGGFAILTHGLMREDLEPEKFTEACNTVLAGCVLRQHLRRAALLVEEMLMRGINPQPKAFNSVVVLLVNARDVASAMVLYDEIIRTQLPLNRFMCKMLLFGLLRAEMFDDADRVLKDMRAAGIRPMHRVELTLNKLRPQEPGNEDGTDTKSSEQAHSQ